MPYSGGFVNGTTQYPLMKQTLPPSVGVVGGTVQSHETFVMGRGLGRGRGRSLLTPARQPNTPPTPMVSAAIGRGNSSLTSRVNSLFNVLTLIVEIRS